MRLEAAGSVCYNTAKMKEAIFMKHFSAFKIVITALFAALICVATMVVQIPIPATGGYINLGDGVILVCAYLLHPALAVIAAGLGSMLADLLAGYMAYVPATLIVKALVALIATLLFHRFGRGKCRRHALIAMLISGLLAEMLMVLGYFFYEAMILGMGMAAAAGIVGNVVQGGVGVAAACIITPILMRSGEVVEMMEKTRI